MARAEIHGGAVQYDVSTAGSSSWRSRGFEFTAASGSSVLEIYSLIPTGPYGPLIDDVRVVVSVGSRYCPAVPNSTGHSASIYATGSSIVSDQALQLVAIGLPPSAFGYFLNSRMQGNVPGAGGAKARCASVARSAASTRWFRTRAEPGRLRSPWI